MLIFLHDAEIEREAESSALEVKAANGRMCESTHNLSGTCVVSGPRAGCSAGQDS